MKKSYIITAAIALSAAAISCSDETNGTDRGSGLFDEEKINIIPTTSRADITDLQDGFTVYATKGSSSTTFEISEQTYAYDSSTSTWNWSGTGDAPTWPESTDDYPMIFYAYYGDVIDSETKYTVTADDSNGLSLTSDITILSSDKQVDILSTSQQTDVHPTSGTLSMEFSHILSQVTLALTATENSRLHIQSIKFCGLKGSNTFDIMEQSWATITSDSDSEYEFLTHSKSALELLSSSSSSTVTSGLEYSPTYATLYLMPHELVSWDLSSTVANGRIEVIFRVTKDADDTTDGDDMLGYSDAEATFGETATSSLTNSNTPLFIKMAIPLSVPTTNTWAAGSSYTYNITLGATGTNNGYFADTVYYDEDGVATTITIDNADIGEEVTSGEICFSVTLKAWTPTDSITLTD
ncbi:MAG: fimbrillin family protein [Rikenellaceae bacterium]